MEERAHDNGEIGVNWGRSGQERRDEGGARESDASIFPVTPHSALWAGRIGLALYLRGFPLDALLSS